MKSAEDELLTFLRDRDMEEEIILKLQNDKIDSSVIRHMSHADIAKYIPHVGDRLAVVAFCRQTEPGISRSQLLGKIRAKASTSRTERRLQTAQKRLGNKNAQKKKKRLEIGWMNFSEQDNRYKQVRTPKGGGTRHVSVDRHTKVREIKEMAESIFFPNEKCRSFKLEEHARTICDYFENEVEPESTVEELYEKNKVKMLRLYLCTKHVSIEATTDAEIDEESEPDLPHLHPVEDSDIIVIEQTVDQSNVPVMERHKNEGGAGPDAQTLAVAQNTDVSHDDSSESKLNNLLPWSMKKVVLVISRSHCLSELIKAFADPDIINKDVRIKRRLPNNGQVEEAEGSGVFRECLSEFWSEFYSKCTLGRNVKVPYLRHEYQSQEWQAVARVLLVGWTHMQYFPLCLALPFLEEVLYGTSFTCLTESFLQYVTKEEQKIFSLALESFESVDIDELIDVLDAHECHYLPLEDTVKEIVSQLAHKTLIQTPMYVIECWKPVLSSLAHTLHPQRLVEIIQERVPTPQT